MDQGLDQNIVIGSLEEIFKDAATAANSNEAVMILGETGVGKEILARYIHHHSRRRVKPFVSINCAAIPGDLVESELFGYKQGAFTGAIKDKKGLLEEGEAGAVFLDEIGEMTLAAQAKLLRVIETKEMLPVGGTKPRQIDVRFITATNTDMKTRVERGEFRRDLYYRLSIFLYTIPPLRQRPGDIPALVRHFIAQSDREITVSPKVMELLLCYSWPGNVRELRSVLTHALAKCKGSTLEMEHLPTYVVESCPRLQVLKEDQLKKKVECFEAKLLEETMRLFPDPREAAQRLGMELRTLYRKIKKYGISPKAR